MSDDKQIIDLNEALEKLADLDPSKAELVKFRYFAGLTIQDAAQLLGISPATAKRWWVFARTWLYNEMKE